MKKSNTIINTLGKQELKKAIDSIEHDMSLASIGEHEELQAHLKFFEGELHTIMGVGNVILAGAW